jgi:hypothetical protein
MDILCLESITVSEPTVRKNTVTSKITLRHLDGKKASFDLKVRYEGPADEKYMEIYRMAMAMPMMNYGLFANSVDLGFPISKADRDLLDDLLGIFSRDIFVNKLVRRRTGHLIEKFLPKGDDISPENARPGAVIGARAISPDRFLFSGAEPGKCGILSSGGKEALTTYSMLKELGADVHPIYVNESGGHWRTALTAYRWHTRTEPNTCRVWTNVDRFYLFMLDNLRIVKEDHRSIPGDTYPIRLCIFPVYLFQLLPVFLDRRIGNLLIGSEFDDPRGEWDYAGIKHYFGIYDQHQDFDVRMEEWYACRIKGMRQWSALRPISGLIVERILTKRYPEAAKYQRSCHSCHFEKEKIVPCGRCTKCLGVMLFLKANNANPLAMGYRKADIEAFPGRLKQTKLRLDPDELEHSISCAFLTGFDIQRPKPHAGGIHIYPSTSDLGKIPEIYRGGIMSILGEHSKGEWVLKGGEWVKR